MELTAMQTMSLFLKPLDNKSAIEGVYYSGTEDNLTWSTPEVWSNSSGTGWTDDLDEDGARSSGHSFCDGLEWQKYMEMVCIPFLTALGLVGNSLSFLVLFSPIYNRRSYSYYLRALAVFDSLTLIITLVLSFNDIVFELSNGTIRYLGWHNMLTCKVTEYLRHVVYLMSSWLVVCFTVDRYIAVCHPLQRARLCTESGAIITLICVFLTACVSQIYILVFVEKTDRMSSMQCHAQVDQRLLYMGLNYFFFSFTLRFALPFLLIVIFNGLIMYHIQRMRKNRISVEREKKHRASLAIYTLFAVCVVFVITLLPNAIIAMLQFTAYIVQRSKALAFYCPLKKVNSPFQMLRLVNYSANFLLYGLTGRQFRREVRKLLTCRLHIPEFHERMREMALMQGINKNVSPATPAIQQTPVQDSSSKPVHHANHNGHF